MLKFGENEDQTMKHSAARARAQRTLLEQEITTDCNHWQMTTHPLSLSLSGSLSLSVSLSLSLSLSHKKDITYLQYFGSYERETFRGLSLTPSPFPHSAV